jgi:glycerol uptake facilitator-like aquaporin
MAERLCGGNQAIALLGNTIPTGAILVVLILILGPISGAHFNPAVSLVMRLRGDCCWKGLAATLATQLIGGILGVWAAHLMFDLPVLQVSTKLRDGPGQWLSEFIATFGLITTILLTVRHRPTAVPASVALYIAAAYWFTASTSFANPAITIARSLSDSFAGIAPASVLPFIAAQFAGALAAHWLEKRVFS